MLVDRISRGSATFTFTDDDLNALGTACGFAIEHLVDESDAPTRALVEALGAVFVSSWYAVKAQLNEAIKTSVLENGGVNGA
jgi:hypothetical protein